MTRTYSLGIPFTFLISGWLFMLLMGILHLNVNLSIPPLGYGMSALIMLFVQLITVLHSTGD